MQNIFFKFITFTVLMPMLILPHLGLTQSEKSFSIQGKINGDYRDNITRVPDSLRIADYRSTLFLNTAYRKQTGHRGRLGISYELRNYYYSQYHNFHRHDHILYTSWQNKINSKTLLHLNNELHLRFLPNSHLYNYRRNISDIYFSIMGPTTQKWIVGYQNWVKIYPHSDVYQNYNSHRIYIKEQSQLTISSRLGVKLEYQHHMGNLYPGSTATNQVLDQNGDRYVFQLFLEKIMGRKIISNLTYKLEKDIPDNPDPNQTGEHFGDENTDELLVEDADFGYLKHQLSLSTLFKIHSRTSFMIFYLGQLKNFNYWQLYEGGPKRSDRIIFLSHIFKLRLYKNLGIEFQFNFEKNMTNIKEYSYHSKSALFGIFF